MLTVSENTKKAYTDKSSNKVLTITFPNANVVMTNDDIVSESFSLKESIESQKSLTYKGCIASQLKFKCADIITDLRGQYVTVTIQADNTDIIPLFHGYVTDQTNQTHEDVLTEITAYDIIYLINKEDVTSWYNGLTFPITVKNFRDSLFQRIGVTQETTTLINDSLTISKTITDKTVIAGDLLKWLCQINARFGIIGRDGLFHYVDLTPISEALYPRNDLYPADDVYPSDENVVALFSKNDYININYEPFKTERIGRVVIYDGDGAMGGSYGNVTTNDFSIEDNPLAYGLSSISTAAQNIYREIFLIHYVPCKIDIVGLPWIECGDSVMVNTMKHHVRTHVLTRTLKGIQALFETYESNSNQYQPVHKQSLKASVTNNERNISATNTNLNNQVSRLDGRIDTTNSNLDNTNGRVSSLEGRASSLEDRASSLETRTSSLESGLSSLSSTVNGIGNRTSSLETRTGNLETALANLQSIAVTTTNWNNQQVSNAMISSLDASKLTGIVPVNCISTNTFKNRDLNLGSGTLYARNITCENELVVQRQLQYLNRDASWSTIGGNIILTGGRAQ